MIENIKQKYYRFNPGEFLPVYHDGKLTNRREFHIYRIKWIIHNRAAAWYMFTHYSSRDLC